jgi:hypothetical protein
MEVCFAAATHPKRECCSRKWGFGPRRCAREIWSNNGARDPIMSSGRRMGTTPTTHNTRARFCWQHTAPSNLISPSETKSAATVAARSNPTPVALFHNLHQLWNETCQMQYYLNFEPAVTQPRKYLTLAYTYNEVNNMKKLHGYGFFFQLFCGAKPDYIKLIFF